MNVELVAVSVLLGYLFIMALASVVIIFILAFTMYRQLKLKRLNKMVQFIPAPDISSMTIEERIEYFSKSTDTQVIAQSYREVKIMNETIGELLHKHG